MESYYDMRCLKPTARKYNNIDNFRVVKRNYKCLLASSLLKTITSVYTPGSPCTDWISPFKTSHGKAMIQYIFLNGTKIIELKESTRISPSVRLRLKRQLENKERPKKTVFHVEKEKGGLVEWKKNSHQEPFLYEKDTFM